MLKRFEDLRGQTLTDISIHDTGELRNPGVGDEIIFTLCDASQYRLYHEQDCYEAVWIEDIDGDINALVGIPILIAEEAKNAHCPEGVDVSRYKGDDDDTEVWTFYKLAMQKGHVTIRWFGTSNGYYSESVGWMKIP